LKDTIRAFKEVVEGQARRYTRASFHMVGTIEQVQEKPKRWRQQTVIVVGLTANCLNDLNGWREVTFRSNSSKRFSRSTRK
jgi:hypothetical protein